MRILHITNHVMEIGNGIVNVAVDLACTQSDGGHQVFYASNGGEYESLLNSHGVQHHQIKLRKSLFGLPQLWVDFRQIIRATRPDIVHAHMMTGAVISRISRPGFGYKLVTHVHNEFQRSARLMGVGDAVIAVSEAVSASMRNRGIPALRLHVIRNGTINSPRVSLAQPKTLNHPAIVTVAGMYERKGIRDLIGAFASLPSHVQAHLYLVGEGPDRAAFEGAAAQSGRAAFIHFEGFQRQPQAYMQDADIFVLASHKEPCALVLSEARELGCAIVATRVGGIPEVLEHGHAGLLFPVGDVSALTTLLLRLIESPEECDRLRNRAQENLQCLTVGRMTGEVLKLYRDMLES